MLLAVDGVWGAVILTRIPYGTIGDYCCLCLGNILLLDINL